MTFRTLGFCFIYLVGCSSGAQTGTVEGNLGAAQTVDPQGDPLAVVPGAIEAPKVTQPATTSDSPTPNSGLTDYPLAIRWVAVQFLDATLANGVVQLSAFSQSDITTPVPYQRFKPSPYLYDDNFEEQRVALYHVGDEVYPSLHDVREGGILNVEVLICPDESKLPPNPLGTQSLDPSCSKPTINYGFAIDTSSLSAQLGFDRLFYMELTQNNTSTARVYFRFEPRCVATTTGNMQPRSSITDVVAERLWTRSFSGIDENWKLITTIYGKDAALSTDTAVYVADFISIPIKANAYYFVRSPLKFSVSTIVEKGVKWISVGANDNSEYSRTPGTNQSPDKTLEVAYVGIPGQSSVFSSAKFAQNIEALTDIGFVTQQEINGDLFNNTETRIRWRAECDVNQFLGIVTPPPPPPPPPQNPVYLPLVVR